MKARIAVDDDLSPVKTYLSDEGYEVVGIESQEAGAVDEVDAVVISGGTRNMLGDQRRRTERPIIDASGLSPQDVARDLQDRLAKKEV